MFADFEYRTRDSWSAKRRVIGKAEWTQGEANPRFHRDQRRSRVRCREVPLRARVLPARRDGETASRNARPTCLPTARPAPTMRANQLRLWLSSFAYVLTCAVRRIGLVGTDFERATCGTIRLHLLKIGALVTVSVRRVKLAFASACPARDVFMLAQRRLCG